MTLPRFKVKYTHGETVPRNKYTVDLDNKTFMSDHYNMIIDFSGFDEWEFWITNNNKLVCGNKCFVNVTTECVVNCGDDCIIACECDSIIEPGKDCLITENIKNILDVISTPGS